MAAGTARKIGIFAAIRNTFFGEPDEAKQAIRKATSHGAFILWLGRSAAFPLMIVFSMGALITIGRHAWEDEWALISAGKPLDPVELATLLFTGLLVNGFDLAMINAALKIRSAKERGLTWKQQAVFWLVLLFVSAIETWTFALMLANIEHPTSVQEWAFLWVRSAGAPVVAIFLATLRTDPPTATDFMRIIQLNAGTTVANFLEDIRMGGADVGQLFSLFALASGYGPEQREQVDMMIDALERLTPESVRADYEARIARLTSDYEQQLTTLEDGVNTTVQRSIVGALMHLMSTGTLPEWAQQLDPSLQGLQLAIGAPKGRKSAPKEPTTKAEAQRQWLRNAFGIEPVSTPRGKRGVWVKSTDVPTLSGGAITGDAATNLARSVGDSTRQGTAYVAPFERLMQELYDRNKLDQEARTWWESQAEASGNVTAFPTTTGDATPDSIGARAPHSRRQRGA